MRKPVVTLDDFSEFLRVDEAALVLGISRGSAYAAVRRGEIPSITIGRLVRVPRESLRELARPRSGA